MEPMENVACIARKQAQMLKLPSGFRFHPTDEELLNHYLMNKVIDSRFCAVAIAEVDLNKCEPWDLPGLAKMGETEWYFFCMRDKKYTTGQRTNRATDAGYWKATGNDREIFISKKTKIGMKKTLVFYKGRPPKGQKTNWVMHEFRLEGNQLHYNLSHQQRSEWVVCRVFEKTNSRKKVHLPKLGEEPLPKNGSPLQPFMDSFDPYMSESSQVACFSNQNSTHDGIVVDSMEATLISDSSPVSLGFVNETPMINNVKSVEIALQIGNSSDCPANNSVPQESSMQKTVVGSNGSSAVQNQKTEPSSEQCRVFDDIDFSTLMNNNDLFYESDDGGNQEYSSASAGDVDIGNLWNF